MRFTHKASCNNKVLGFCQATVGSLHVPLAFGGLELSAHDDCLKGTVF